MRVNAPIMHEMTAKEVAQDLGLSVNEVLRIERQALRKLWRLVREAGLNSDDFTIDRALSRWHYERPESLE